VVTLPEHLDGESCDPADTFDDGWADPYDFYAQDLSLADLSRYGLRRVRDLRVPLFEEQRDADFDDEERRP
jgi:hypothetical protein